MLLAGLLLALAGCSTLRVAYNQADHLLAWMAHEYFDLDGPQRQDFNTRLDALLKWHRQQALPDYVRFLGEVKQRAGQGVSRADAIWVVEGVKSRYRLLAARGAPDAAAVLATLTPDNLRALEKQFAKVNRKFEREYQLGGSRDEQRRARTERTLKRIREWTGPLSRAQEERIGALYEGVPYSEKMRLQERERRQREFLALLKQRHNQADFARALAAWLADWERGRPAQVEQALQEAYEKRVAFYLEVERLLTPAQRAHVLGRIERYIGDLNALMGQQVAMQKNQ